MRGSASRKIGEFRTKVEAQMEPAGELVDVDRFSWWLRKVHEHGREVEMPGGSHYASMREPTPLSLVKIA